MNGLIGDKLCDVCHGRETYGTYPGIVMVGGEFVALSLFRKAAKLPGIEFTVMRIPSDYRKLTGNVIGFRFDGGEGVLAPIDPTQARERVEGARCWAPFSFDLPIEEVMNAGDVAKQPQFLLEEGKK